MSSFVHLHVHSDYSPMEGVSSVQALCEAARTQGADTLALTDTNGLYGAIRFIDVARQAGLKPILGAEVRLGKGRVSARLGRAGETGERRSHRALLLAKTTEGYANLCRLLSERHCDAAFSLIEAVSRYRHGLIVLSDDTQALTAWKKESADDLYVELTAGPGMHEALAFSRRAEIPPVATNHVRFVNRGDFDVHRLLRAIALNTTLSRLPEDACCSPSHWLMPLATMQKYYPHVPEALENTVRIAQACRTDWDFNRTIFPAFRRLSKREAFATLRDKTYAGAVWRYGTVAQNITDRIEEELTVIRKKGFADYFLVVDEIVRQTLLTCGRGSVAASIVSYCLGITHVDPIKHHLFFGRFLNPGRRDPPDIDIDFPWDERDRIFEWVFKKYGVEQRQAAMVANQNSLGLRAAIREVAKVYGMPAVEIGDISARILRQKDLLWFEDMPTAQDWARRLSRELKLPPPWPEILSLAVQAQGHFRHLSLHCGGVVIVPDEIRRYVPVEPAAKEIAAEPVPVIQWEKDQAEEAGLVKIDLLGNRSLAVIRDALNAIERNTGRRLDYATWDPLDDHATQDLIRRGDSIGCFYIESPATRLLLRKLWGGMPADRLAQTDVFEHLVVVSSLVRPAAISFVHAYIRRAHGMPYTPLHPVLNDVLAETHGIMVYQEDVTKVAMALAGFSLNDADQLRKIISKKHKQRQLQDYRAQFYRGAMANGAPVAVVDEIWAMIMSFAGYSFCKPHSASYAQVSFKCAYLRAHYPAEFMAAVISNQGGFYSAFAYVSEARRMGLTILPPDINASTWAYLGNGRTIRVGFMQIKSLGKAFADRVIAERDAGSFRSFHDFMRRLKPEPAQTRLLIRAGCFDSIAGELTRPALLWRLQAAQNGSGARALPIPPEYPQDRRLQHEIETLGFPLSRHPLDLYHARLKNVEYIPAADMAAYAGRQVTMIGWLVTEKMTHTKAGDPMEFVTLEDLTTLYEATFFPEAYRRFCHLLSEDRPYVLKGLIEEEFGTYSLVVHDLECPLLDREGALRERVGGHS
ncbi:MAG: DNA polymerase III subunit alpha [Nitrospirae bacterium]|nr:MAG: DNA polymerase III subunit alpha [Nitrospirota bacterium]